MVLLQLSQVLMLCEYSMIMVEESDVVAPAVVG